MSRSNAARDGLALLGGLAFGVVAVFGVGWVREQNRAEAIVFTPDDRVVSIGATADLGPGVPTPLDAIDRFLLAEIDDNAEDSLALLAPTDRQTIRTINSWERTRRNRIGRLVSFSPIELEIADSGRTAIATTTLELVPSLDPINGLTPPSASAEWHLVDDEGWRVDLGASVITPDYLVALTAADAEAAARAWMAGDAACAPLDAAGDRATFRSSVPALTEALCSSSSSSSASPNSDIVVGPPIELSSVKAAEGLTASFGSSIPDWAVVVPLYAPLAADLVLAPVGDQWIVIDVLER